MLSTVSLTSNELDPLSKRSTITFFLRRQVVTLFYMNIFCCTVEVDSGSYLTELLHVMV